MAGYQAYIAKGNFWEDSTPKITLEEWKELCNSDPEFRIQTEVSARNPNTGEVITINGEAMCFWKNPKDGVEYLFDYRDGQIVFQHEDEAIPKAKEIAAKFGGVVQGEEGEEY